VQRAAACVYAYDASGLLARLAIPGQTGTRFWRGDRVVNELRTSTNGNTQLTWLRALGQPIVEQVSGAVARLTLLASAISGSVLLEADTAVRTAAYAPHGSRPDGEVPESAKAEPAFNGEPLDAASGCYLLGAGHHRPYSPTLGMFLAPDSASPFGAGGLNTLSYCAGDPINRADPTGHFWKWVVAAVGVAFGVAAVVGSFGAASVAVGAVMAGGFAALTKAGAVAIATFTLGTLAVGAELGAVGAMANGDTKAAMILGGVGAGLGVITGAPAIAKAAARGAAKFSSFSQRIGTIRRVGLSGRGATPAARQMAQEGASAGANAAARRSALYIDDAAEAAAQRRGYPMFDELSSRGQRNATRNAGTFTRQNAMFENSLDFNHQSGLYSYFDRRVITRWDPSATGGSSARASRASNQVPVNLREFTRRVDGAPPSYAESLNHRVAPSDLGTPPPYSRRDPNAAIRTRSRTASGSPF
jgi:RHS repeat-associated protein